MTDLPIGVPHSITTVRHADKLLGPTHCCNSRKQHHSACWCSFWVSVYQFPSASARHLAGALKRLLTHAAVKSTRLVRK
jgi:hypothetical protein